METIFPIQSISESIAIHQKGTYVLILHLKSDRTIRIGRLGRFHFLRGYYAYYNIDSIAGNG